MNVQSDIKVQRKVDCSKSGTDLPWWKGAVIYQIYPRSFADSNGDGIGDLKGITARLDHVASLGVDAVWLSPFFTSPMADFGYDVADFCDVDPMFGSLADFDALLARAHDLGLKVIIDQVYSHTSDQHDWFVQSRASKANDKADWYVWVDPNPDGTPPNNWQSVFGGGAWEWDARRGQYYLHNFLREQPDLNLHNPDVQNAILAVTEFWLERGVDGFRLDALNFGMHDRQLRDNPVETVFKRPPTRPFDFQRHTQNMSQPEIVPFIERIAAKINEYPGRFTVAEVGGPFPLDEMKAFTAGSDRLNSAYAFDFLYAPELTADLIRKVVSDWPGEDKNEGWPSWAFSNHDAPRAISRWAGDCVPERYAKLIAMVIMSLRGNAFVYQGEELALPQAHVAFEDLQDPEAITNWPETLGRDGARTPMVWTAGSNDNFGFGGQGKPWLPIDPRHGKLTADKQNVAPDSVLNFYRKVIALRQASGALRSGSLEWIAEGSELLIYGRTSGGETRLCAFNLTDKDIELPDGLSVPQTAIQIGDVQKGTTILPAYSGFISV